LGTYTISDSIHVEAPVDRCFLLSTSIDIVAQTLRLKPIVGKTSGLIGPSDRVLWHGWKLGLPQLHESVITAYQRPYFFQDTMDRGRFQRFQHDHTFSEIAGHTLLQDKIRFSLPLGWLGSIVAKWILVPYLARILRMRLESLRYIAQTEEWRKYLTPGPTEPQAG
jgi:ligand-binding SRPBCC domain-containing protein